MDVQNFDGTDFFFGRNSLKEFQIELIKYYLFCFLLLSKVMIFLKFVKKYTHCHFVDNKTFIMMFFLLTFVEHEMGIFFDIVIIGYNKV